MRRVGNIRPRDALRAFRSLGYHEHHRTGSHHILVHEDPDRPLLSVPIHAGGPLRTGTLRALIKRAGLTVQEFLDLLGH